MKTWFPFDRRWPIAEAAQTACLLEASAAKPGNVHPTAGFSDMRFEHFVASAVAVGRVFTQVEHSTVGGLVLAAVQATQSAVGRNTNLGTLLLFAPLAKAATLSAPLDRSPMLDFRQQLSHVLDGLTAEDCRSVYTAIRLAQPGGLGDQAHGDVRGEAPASLLVAMQQVAEVDAVARQYTSVFADVFERLLPWFAEELAPQDINTENSTLDAICRLQLRWLAHEPDGLIVRKLGSETANEVRRRAAELLPQVQAHRGMAHVLPAVQEFDHYLRGDGHRRNPGTTADLIAATLFVGLLFNPLSLWERSESNEQRGPGKRTS